MITAVRSLRSAVDALIQTVGAIRTSTIAPEAVGVRIEEAFLSWATLRAELQHSLIDPELLGRLDRLFSASVRLTTKESPKRAYQAHLGKIREVLAGGLTEFAIRNELLPLSAPARSESLLLAEISDLPNELIPRGLLGWIPDIKKFLRESPFENNAFIMVAYRRRLEKLITTVKACVKDLGLNPVMARDRSLTDNLDNPIACLLCCKYGIAIFDRGEEQQTHNANVVYELAVMQTLKRPCLLLKNSALPRMPTDFLHRLYQPYRTTNDAAARLREWWRAVNPGAIVPVSKSRTGKIDEGSASSRRF